MRQASLYEGGFRFLTPLQEVSVAAASIGQRADKSASTSMGLTFWRYWSNSNIDSFDGVEWELRTALISDEQGAAIFEQKGVEFPTFWTQQATNVVASKYFRGHLDSPNREHSVRQLIGRVVTTLGRWGRKGNYFASEDDAAAFEEELKHLLLHQMLSFNSPVWFNLGVEGAKPQCSACFINSVEDSMESIMELAATEARLFKGGSGTGTNFSSLRSSREGLTGGGIASGPVSFMRGYDAFAGAIKSGGKTRRAAKMVILNVSHPDILDFIRCKSDEEKKAWALIEAGYNGGFNVPGGAYDSIQFQNANHSVRVTDSFMQAVERDREWKTHYVITQEEATSHQARDIMRIIAECTHVCGDPGMQFDTTINKWHTMKNTDRIFASNPCWRGDSLVLTEEGYKPVADLVGKEFRVWGKARCWERSRAFPTGIVSQFLRVRLNDGTYYDVTPNHNFIDADGSKIQADKLAKGSRLLRMVDNPSVLRLLDRQAYLDGFMMGWGIGDGWMSWIKQSERWQVGWMVSYTELEMVSILEPLIQSHSNRRDLPHFHPNKGTGCQELNSCSKSLVRHVMDYWGFVGKSKGLPERVKGVLEESEVLGLISGLFASDGSVSTSTGEVAFYTAHERLAKDLQLLLVRAGFASKVSHSSKPIRPGETVGKKTYSEQRDRDQYRVLLNGPDAVRLLASLDLTVWPSEKQKKAEALRDRERQNYRTRPWLKVSSVEVLDLEEPIFNLEVEDDHHQYVMGTIWTSNCSEFMFLNDTACNLASLNLMKFRNPDGTFDHEAFTYACEVAITAQEIIVDNASYPTERIAQNSYAYRPLGLGYANLGALLMSNGIPYDSGQGRSLAGAITSLMSAAAYRQSARMAAAVGVFDGYIGNSTPMLEVMAMHQAEHTKLVRGSKPNDTPLLLAGQKAWDEVLQLGKDFGFRNSQATVLAPTGTIAFMMDCDTTGIEPDIALVKYKTLVGGGHMKIVNQTVPEALRTLGYTPEQVDGIAAHIDQHGTIEGCALLDTRHLAVFDCAFKPQNGSRSIHHMGHLRMMAAAQPFISGAISKTVNVPEDATAETIEETYMEAWRLGLKAVAIYRDGSKRTQPLQTSLGVGGKVAEIQPFRRKLPDERQSLTHKFTIGGHKGYITVGLYEDGTPGEIFITMSKEGSVVSGLMDSFATTVSIALQFGVPLDVLVRKFSHARFEPSGWTGNKEIPIAKSIVDYLFRWLALKFLPCEEQPAQHEASLSNGFLPVTQEDAPPCSGCGSIMTRSGSCYRCLNCGSTSGCS